MKKFSPPELKREVEECLKRNKEAIMAIFRFQNRNDFNETSEYNKKLCNNFDKESTYLNYLTNLSKDLYPDENICENINKTITEKQSKKSILNILKRSNDKDFNEILDEMPYAGIYIKFLDETLNKIKDNKNNFINHFSIGENHMEFSDEKIDDYIEEIDTYYNKPHIILEKLIEINNKENLHNDNINEKIIEICNLFETEEISLSTENEFLLENVQNISNDGDIKINLLSSPEKMNKLVEKVKESNIELNKLYKTASKTYKNNINSSNFIIKNKHEFLDLQL